MMNIAAGPDSLPSPPPRTHDRGSSMGTMIQPVLSQQQVDLFRTPMITFGIVFDSKLGVPNTAVSHTRLFSTALAYLDLATD
jgi:hypothetical protein